MTWCHACASVIGTSHRDGGTPCQDYAVVEVIDDDTVVLVASDGAGSATHSADGSRITCELMAAEATTYVRGGGRIAALSEATTDQWMQALAERLRREAEERGITLRQLACTLVMALVGSDSTAVLQVGDGGIVARRDGGYVPVTWPAAGEYVNTTYFVTDDDEMHHRIGLFSLPACDEVALFTDGLQMLALQFDTRMAHGPFFQPLFERLRVQPPGDTAELNRLLGEYLASPAIERRTDDDKTLILAVRHGTAEVGEASETHVEADDALTMAPVSLTDGSTPDAARSGAEADPADGVR